MFDVHTFYLETVFTDVCRSSTISGKYTKYSELGIRRLGFRPRQKNVPSSVNSIQFKEQSNIFCSSKFNPLLHDVCTVYTLYTYLKMVFTDVCRPCRHNFIPLESSFWVLGT
uniref:Uncharacterized protein n=1 Tax=Cacopsylla melanoneura TaxID=428564 RepID=A0A8D8TFM7_9HEMI